MKKRDPVSMIKAVAYVFLFVLIQVLVSAVCTAVIMARQGDAEEIEALVNENATLLTLLSNAVTLLVIALFFRLRGKDATEEIYCKPLKPTVGILCLILGVSLSIFVNGILNVIPWPDAWVAAIDDYTASLESGELLLQILTVVILAPVTEEIVFRGLCCSRFARFSEVLAIVGSAILFGLVHGTMIGICYATAMGLYFAFLFRRTKSVVPGMICHIGFNGFSLFSGALPDGAFFYILLIISLIVTCLLTICVYRFYPSDSAGKDDHETL